MIFFIIIIRLELVYLLFHPEHTTTILGTALLQTDLFLDYLFRKKQRQFRFGDPMTSGTLGFCDWSSGYCESVIRGKFNLKINRSVRMPRHEHNRVVGCGSWVPGITEIRMSKRPYKGTVEGTWDRVVQSGDDNRPYS